MQVRADASMAWDGFGSVIVHHRVVRRAQPAAVEMGAAQFALELDLVESALA